MIVSLRRSLTCLTLMCAGAFAGCSSGSSSPAPVAPQGVPSVATPIASPVAAHPATAVAYGADALAGATFVRRAKLARVGADVLMTMSDPAGLVAFAAAANDPKNPSFRRWLTPQELGDRFGAPASAYAAAEKYFVENGIAVEGYPQRQILRVAGPQANVERALGLQYGFYRKNGQTFLAPMAAPRPATSLHIAALGNVVRYSARSRRYLSLGVANGLIQGYSPQQIRNGFDFSKQGGAGIAIGIIGTGPITDGDPRIKYGDVAEFRALYGLTGTGVVKQDADTSNYATGNTGVPGQGYTQSGLATPPPVTSASSAGCIAQGYDPGAGNNNFNITDYSTCNPEDLEAQLDTEQAAALANDATINFYIAYNPSECFGPCDNGATPTQQLGIDEADDEIQQAIADNASDVISISFGEDELSSTQQGYFGTGTNNFEPVEFASLASEGIAVFVSSGDLGAEECMDNSSFSSTVTNAPCVSYPATDPSVMSVGGVNAPFDAQGQLTGPLTGWGLGTQAGQAGLGYSSGGSGGGCSQYFSEPAYAAKANLPCAGKRAQPDVALDADTATGVAVVLDADPSIGGRQIFRVGGTSVSTPEMAAMWGNVVAVCKQTVACSSRASGTNAYRLGNPGSYLYAIYENPALYASSFYDVLFGNNSLPVVRPGGPQDPGFNAGVGYDEVTGLGAPYGNNLASAVLSVLPSL
jgi:subtilase family serine protease